MRLLRPRLTVGRLLVLVAVLGLGCAAGALVKRSDDYRCRAESAEAEADLLRDRIRMFDQKGGQAELVPGYRAFLVEAEREARRYRAAQRRPWLLVPSDPK